MTNNASLLKQVRKYEGRTVKDFLGSEIAKDLGIAIFKVNGKALEWGDNETDSLTIDYINIRNVMGYMFADLTTEEVSA